MREIEACRITQEIKRLILEASYRIGPDVDSAIRAAAETDPSPTARAVLRQLAENYEIARTESVAICQDTGMAIVFLDIGQDVHVTGGSLSQAVDEGVRSAYRDGYLRKSVVRDPLYDRTNTQDNTPGVTHVQIVPGDRIGVTVTLKGFGSENMSQIKMLVPADGESGVVDFAVRVAEQAGPNPCPPIILGVGIGGTFETAALMAKRMTARPIDQWNPDPRYAALEKKICDRINALGIGPAGTGGRTTCLKVSIETCPTHIAGMPVAVNVCCHAARHAHGVI